MLRDGLARLEASLGAMISLSPAQQAAVDVLRGPARNGCLAGGTRSGKTLLIVKEIFDRADRFPGSRHAMLRYRANAARASLALDTIPNVRRKYFPNLVLDEHRQDGFFELANGSQIWIGGLDDKDRVEKILGLEFCTLFLNEASQIPYASALIALTRLAQVVPGLPQKAYVDLNPVEKSHWTNVLFGDKRDPITRLPLRNPDAYARAFLNPVDNRANLDPAYFEMLANSSARHRKRFFEGIYLDEVEGALWSMTLLDKCRIPRREVPDLRRVVIAIDPAVSTNETSNETGIIAAGLGVDGNVYVLEDGTGRYNPTEWASKAILMYEAHNADRIVAETNQGGAMVEATVRAVNPRVAYKGVHASRGKITRAEPVSALYEAGRVFHAGDFVELEEQLVSYVAGMPSPDRMDALVWAVTELGIGPEIRSSVKDFWSFWQPAEPAAPEWFERGDLYPPHDFRWKLPDGIAWVARKLAAGAVDEATARERGWVT